MEETKINKKITYSIVAVLMIVLITIGATYAYFSAEKSTDLQTVTTGTLDLTFNDGIETVKADGITPLVREVALPVQDSTGKVTMEGKAATTEFTITNTGNQKMFVDISLDEMTLPDDLKRYDFLWSLYEVTDKTNNIEKNIGTGSFEYAENGMKIGQYLVFDAPGDGVTTHQRTFKLYIWIEETYIEQNDMRGQTFQAKIKATGQKYYTSPENDFVVSADGTLTAYTGTDTDIVIPPVVNGVTVTSIGENTRIASTLNSVVIPDTVTTISEWAFSQNPLTNVVIPNSITTIGDQAFFDNQQLTSVILPNSISALSTAAFDAANIKSIVIPNNVTMMPSLSSIETNIIIPNSVTVLNQIGGQLTKVVIPSNVTSIAQSAFLNVQTLTEIIIIGKDSLDDFENLGDWWNCKKTSDDWSTCEELIPVTFKP